MDGTAAAHLLCAKTDIFEAFASLLSVILLRQPVRRDKPRSETVAR
jgi:hypothetical protein